MCIELKQSLNPFPCWCAAQAPSLFVILRMLSIWYHLFGTVCSGTTLWPLFPVSLVNNRKKSRGRSFIKDTPLAIQMCLLCGYQTSARQFVPLLTASRHKVTLRWIPLCLAPIILPKGEEKQYIRWQELINHENSCFNIDDVVGMEKLKQKFQTFWFTSHGLGHVC